jgi:hypothetical protein
MAKNDLTTEARVGYDGNPNPHLYSSASWYAHSLGQYLHATGRAPPRDVRMSRGYSMRVADSLYKHDDKTGWTRIN